MRGISAWLALTAACQLSEALPDRDSTDQDRGISAVADMRLPGYNDITSCVDETTIDTSITSTTTSTTTTTPTVYVSVTATQTISFTTTIATDGTQIVTSGTTSTTIFDNRTATVTQTSSTMTVTTGLSRREATQHASKIRALPTFSAVDPMIQPRDALNPASSIIIITETSTAPIVVVTTTVATTQISTVAATTLTTSIVTVITRPFIATTTVTQTVATTTKLVVDTVTVPPPLRTGQLNQVGTGFSAWTIIDEPPLSDLQAFLANSSDVEVTSDAFGWGSGNEPVTLLRSTLHPQAVESIMYYDPADAFYGPLGSISSPTGGSISFLAAVPSGDEKATFAKPVRCDISSDDHLLCDWDELGSYGIWLLCDNILALAKVGYSPGPEICSNKQSLQYVKWSDVVL